MKENNHERYLSALRRLTYQALQALRGTTGLYAVPEGIKVRVECACCGLAYLTPEEVTVWRHGGFISYTHCGLVRRSGSLTAETMQMLIDYGAQVHVPQLPAITFADYLEFVDEIRATATPQEELL